MMETVILLLFIAGLLGCVISGLPVSAAMVWGLLLFGFYAGRKGFSFREIGSMLLSGVRKVVNVLLVMMIIGALTASWRMSGTVAYIVYHAAGLIVPQFFVLCAFLLCCAISAVLGSSFSTVSTAGAICMLMGRTMGLNPLAVAGAVLAGSFFGDRCSPMSSSALLVAGITHTRIHDNVRTMIRTSLVPFAASCLIYLLLGGESTAASSGVLSILETSFVLKWPAVIPAVLAIALCLFRIDVKITMLLSTACALILSVTLQGVPVQEALRALAAGFHPQDAQLSALLGGGGVVSMVNVIFVVCLSSSFSGIFDRTGLLSGLEQQAQKCAEHTTRELTMVLISVVSAAISCNQTLAALLTDQLTKKLVPDGRERASWMEDSVIVIAALIPWTIACSVPLSIVQADARAVLYASYLYLLPLWLILRGFWRRKIKRLP